MSATVAGVGAIPPSLTQATSSLESQLENLTTQLGTGNVSTTYAGLGTGRDLVVGLASQLSAFNGFQSTNTIINTQLSLAQTALGQIASVGQKVQNVATNSQYTPGAGGITTDQTTAVAQLDELVSALNTQSGDSYIFSGRATNQPTTATADQILNGSGSQAGLEQVIAERKQADLGSDGLGRLVIPAVSGTVVSLSEDVAGSPFGFKLAGVSSTLNGATVTGPSGSPASISINEAANPNAGDTINFTFNLPDGSTQGLTLTATTASPPGTNQFTIGATPAATASNLQAALTSSIGTLAQTQLAPASAITAGQNFFNIDVNQPPQRVSGPPFGTATSLVNGTPANTVIWYTGEMNTDPALNSAVARVGNNSTVSYGMRANESALRNTIANVAVFAATSFSAANPDSSAAYAALSQKVAQGLTAAPGSQSVSDIEADIANAQTTISNVTTQQQQTQLTVQSMLQGIENISTDQVASQLLSLQSSLQASMQAAAMLSHDSLTNYI